MKVKLLSNCTATIKTLDADDFEQYYSYFEDNAFFTCAMLTRSYCSSTALIIYADSSFYSSSESVNQTLHLPGVTNNEYRTVYLKLIETLFKSKYQCQPSRIVIGHEHDTKGKCFLQVCCIFPSIFQKTLKLGSFTVESSYYNLLNGVTFYFMKQKARYTSAINQYIRKGGDYFTSGNSEEETSSSFRSKQNKRKKQMTLFSQNTPFMNNRETKSSSLILHRTNEITQDENVNNNMVVELDDIDEGLTPLPSFSWVPNESVFTNYPFIKKWYELYAIPENLRKRKALLLYSDCPSLGKTEFAKRLVNNEAYCAIMQDKFQNVVIKTPPKLGILDNLTCLPFNHQTFREIITGQRALVNENEMNFYWPYEIPWIITTRNWDLVKFLYKSDEFNKFIMFVEIRDYLGPKGTEPEGMNETEAWFSKDTWNFLKKEEEKRKENNKTENEIEHNNISLDEIE